MFSVLQTVNKFAMNEQNATIFIYLHFSSCKQVLLVICSIFFYFFLTETKFFSF